MQTTIERKEIVPLLEKLKINQSEVFSLAQLDSVVTTIDRLHAKHFDEKLRFTRKRNTAAGTITVTRKS